MTAKFICRDGPYNGRTFTYPDPLPNMIVFADAHLDYHEYTRLNGPRRRNQHISELPQPIYRWERSYRIPKTQLDQQHSGEILAW